MIGFQIALVAAFLLMALWAAYLRYVPMAIFLSAMAVIRCVLLVQR